MSSGSKQMKVATRLSLGFGGAVVLGVAIAAIGALAMRSLSTQLDLLANDRMVKVEKFSRLKDNVNVGAGAARNMVISKDPAIEAAERKKLDDARAENAKLLDELDKMLVVPKARELLKAISDNRVAYNQGLDDALAMDAKGDSEPAGKLLMNAVREKENAIFKAIDEATELQRGLAVGLATEAKTSSSNTALLLVGLAFAMAVLGALVTWLLVRSFSRALGAEPSELGAAAQLVAAGDLSPVVGAATAHAGSVLASLSEMQLNLANIVGQVRASSDSIATGSAQIAIGNADLSQRTEEQASNLQQTAASMEQLSGTVKNTADTASQASEMAMSASAAAVKGGELVGNVVSTMQDIVASSKKIADIIGVIDGIAFQTNILALNAAVEAARAGEQGRGFAVVASEVRSLAGRSAEAAKEIKALIGASVDKVEAGTRQVNEAGASMGEIVSQVQRVSQAIGEISSATTEQSTGIGQVGEAVTQLDQVTQQNAALVEESAAAAESLKHQAAKLAEVVGVFKLDGIGASPAPRPVDESHAAGRVVERRSPNRAANVVRPDFKAASAAKPKAPVHAPAAAAPAHAAPPTPALQNGTDDWETF
ncbi:MAG: methyl-accepting chemotaxis protein [Burkholderiales bacterium]